MNNRISIRTRLPSLSGKGKTVTRVALLLACGGWLLGSPAFANEVTVFEDNFDGHVANAIPADPWMVSESELAGTVRVLQDGADVFGTGPTNQLLEYRADGVDSPLAFWLDGAFAAEVASIRFRFSEADSTEFPDFSWIILYAGSRSTGNRAQVIPFGEGNLGDSGSYANDVVNDVELVVNNSNKDIIYRDSFFLEGGHTDIWINGELAQAGFTAQNNQRGEVSGFEINISGSRKQLLLLDDLIVQSMSPEFVEPEPLIIFDEQFTNHAPNSIPGEPWTLVFDGPGIGAIRARSDAEDIFGKGTSNHYLEYRKDGTDGTMALRSLGTLDAVVSTFSLRYMESASFEDFTWLILYAGSRSTGNRAQVMNFGNAGHLGDEAAKGVINQVDLVVNNSDDPVTYLDSHTVAPGSVDIWVNGQLANDDFSGQNNRRGPVTGFEFNTSGTRTQTLLIDELVVRNHAFVTDYVPVERPFDLWRETHFTAGEIEDESVSGPLADASGDGIPNLLAYALDLDPRTPAPPEAVPQSEITPEGLTLSFRRIKGAADIQYVVEVSDDLVAWTTGEEAVEIEVIADEGETEWVRAVDKVPGDHPRRFIRLRIELL